MLPNPYTPGELPQVLAGREREKDRIRSYLSRIATYGEIGGPLLVFQGPRGVGKTCCCAMPSETRRSTG